jgi:hypothetical protein
VEERKIRIPKWGFGMAPISPLMQGRYDFAVQGILAVFVENLPCEEVDPDLLSELKGMFNRCIRQDQWDWFSVYTQFGEPKRGDMQRIGPLLYDLRASTIAGNIDSFYNMKQKLQDTNLLKYLRTFYAGGLTVDSDGVSGWIYILSTRQQPKILKIGMTTRSVFQRVKEINGATGVLYPFSARAVYRVTDAVTAEKEVFALMQEYRIRPDREFFEVDYAVAARKIGQLLSA